MSNPLWHYAVDTYSREGVAAACLRLQDGHGVDVNLLLYAAWLAARGERLTGEHLRGLEVEVAPWRDRVVRPLRALRRDLADYADARDVREEVKGLELAAERRQHELMFAFHRRSAPLPREAQSLGANLSLVVGSSTCCDAGAGAAIALLQQRL